MPELTRTRSIFALLSFLAAAFAVCASSARVAASSIHIWYHTLRQPPLSPPDWVFAPVWTILFALMAVSAWLAWRTRVSSCRSGGLRMWAVQLLINFVWTAVFFGLRSPAFALIDLVLLVMGIVFTMRPFLTIRPLAAWLLAPYLAWTLFALYLNIGIVVLNH